MRNVLIAVCCAALVGGVSAAASAQTTGPATQDSMKTNSPMDSNAKTTKKKTKKSMTKSDEGMSKGDMSKGGMKSTK
jgi:pentapeptide MXKDX repeat protein